MLFAANAVSQPTPGPTHTYSCAGFVAAAAAHHTLLTAPPSILILHQGCVPMGEADWERLRIVQGRPAPGAELTDAYNPLEAGLCHAVSLNKGCYIGQETLAKVGSSLWLYSCFAVLWQLGRFPLSRPLRLCALLVVRTPFC